MITSTLSSVWVFHGANGRFSSGVFTTRELAENWINQYSLTGVLTEYPLDISVYDWALRANFFTIKNEAQSQPEFIQKFTTAIQEHYHYENGVLD